MYQNRKTVKVIVLSSPPLQPFLEFSLIFDDGFEKHYILGEYELRAFRGLRELEIVEEMAMQYYEMNGQTPESLELIIF